MYFGIYSIAPILGKCNDSPPEIEFGIIFNCPNTYVGLMLDHKIMIFLGECTQFNVLSQI
jgi:hypothetical protein